jgi:exonuclease VII small subunit
MECRNSRECGRSRKHECGREPKCAICDVERGIRELEEGIRVARVGLEMVRRCEVCEGVKCLEEAVRELRKGLETVRKGLKHTVFAEGHRRREIEEILCQIERFIECIEKAIRACCHGDLERGIAMLEEAIHCIEKEIARLQEIICHRERKHECFR